MKPVQTACTSKAGTPRAMPSRACDLGRRRRKGVVGRRRRQHDEIDVALAGTAAAASARSAARTARSEVNSPGAATWRWRMPVRCTIHSSEVSSALGKLGVGDDPLGQDSRRSRERASGSPSQSAADCGLLCAAEHLADARECRRGSSRGSRCASCRPRRRSRWRSPARRRRRGSSRRCRRGRGRRRRCSGADRAARAACAARRCASR